MKHRVLLLLISLVSLISFSVAQAHPAQVALDNAFFADQMPAGASIYIGIRTDDAYIDELNGILDKVTTGLSAIAPDMPTNMNIRQLLDQVVMSIGVEGDFQTAIRPWLGDKVGIGIYFGEQSPENIFIAIDHTNRELAEAFIENVSRGALRTSVEGDFTVYTTNNDMAFIAINNDTIYITSLRELIPFTGNTLHALRNYLPFQQAVEALPSDSYNVIVIAQTARLAQMGNGNRNDAIVQAVVGDGYTAIGATITDGVSLTLDVVQTGLPAQVTDLLNTPVDPAFTQYIPSNATAVIHGTNLIAAYNALIQLVSANTGQDLQAQLTQAQALFGFDVISLLLSGDFATYFTYKPQGLTDLLNTQLDALNQNTMTSPTLDIAQFAEFGVIFEISDPANAQSLVDQLFNLYGLFGGNNGVTATQEEIAGHNALILTVNATPSMSSFDIVIGANEAVFVIGTRESATAVLSGTGGFDSNPFYQNSLGYTLPDMTHYWFLDRTVIMTGTGIFGFLLTPVVGSETTGVTFDVETGVSATFTPNPTQEAQITRQQEIMREQSLQGIESMTAFNDVMQGFSQLFDNATVSVSSKDDILFVRAVITFSE
ncbi:MAG: DUF3352 domain-containing protein [bacterium]|nr:DUF3352 domain-containing protein [bacterium]